MNRRLVRDSPNPCEWNPAARRQAYPDDIWHADAKFAVVGPHDEMMRICEHCSRRSPFLAMHKVREMEPRQRTW